MIYLLPVYTYLLPVMYIVSGCNLKWGITNVYTVDTEELNSDDDAMMLGEQYWRGMVGHGLNLNNEDDR